MSTVSPVSEIEDGEDRAVEGSTGVTRGEAQPGVPDPLLLLSGALEAPDVLGRGGAPAHRGGEDDVRPADSQEVGPQSTHSQLPDARQQLNE